MTEIRLHKEGHQILFEVEGHAEYAYEGADIVCAACSVLSGTLATLIDSLPVSSDIEFGSGRLRIALDQREIGGYMLTIKHAIEFAMVGYRLLEERYPSNVIITEW